jgi:hypothetical protein
VNNAGKKKAVSIGIDPGWKNLGLAVVEKGEKPFKIKVIGSMVLNPSVGDLTFIEDLPIIINTLLKDTLLYEVGYLAIERYVPYNNVFSAETENITMLIGMLRTKLFHSNECCENGVKAQMVRAIDWKITLAQWGAKYCGFDNPSSGGLDKGYSKAMARFLTENKYDIKTDHEADAICLAALPFVDQWVQEHKRSNK